MMTKANGTQIEAQLTTAHHSYEKGLNSYAYFKVSDHATGEDLVQDTFLKTWKYLVKGGKIDIMRAFLYHILNNLIVDQYRKRKTTSLDALIDNGFDSPTLESPKQLFNILDGKVAILKILELPNKYQQVMRMKYVQNLSIKEISLLTGQTRNATTVQLYRGLQKLKLLYSPA